MKIMADSNESKDAEWWKEFKTSFQQISKEYAAYVLPLIERFGEEAKQIAYKSRFDYGYNNVGRKLASMASKNDLVEFEKVWIPYLTEFRGLKGLKIGETVEVSENRFVWRARSCPCWLGIPIVWEEMGLNRGQMILLGEVFCHAFDSGTAKAFNPKIELKYTQWQPRGDPYCEFLFEIKEKEV
jgi:hypothetical protein